MLNDAKLGIAAANLLVIAMIAFFMLNLANIPLISPADGAYTTERNPEFAWGGMQGDFVVSIDDDPGFGSPITMKVTGNSHRLVEDLAFGTYYWKVASTNAESETRSFTVDSSVVVSRGEEDLTNEGNTEILVHTFTGAMVVGIGDSIEVGEDDNVKAEQA